MLISDACFSLTTFYGPANDRRKDEFLQEMISSKPPAGTPWLIMGDFNLIYKASDKNNLNLNRRLMGKFRAALDDCELMEICLQNRKFTWSNERENPTLDTVPRKASFRFEDHWLHTDGFSEVVEQAWSKQQSGSALTVLRKKLTETARALRQWSKPLFSKARLQLHIANEVIMRLEIAQERRHLSDGKLALRKELKLRVLGLAAVERSRRRQASRFIWLKAGDACTKFFHLKMSTRR
ncbi:uncharacterized protein [Miscanthus floridulus]|uniref:uncharacterized protein n=1 Tax=Miscanthus floridulus TaxID=154761 RepID=UPI0034591077